MASDMTVQPLPKHLLDKAIALGIQLIELGFSGGSDEGSLYVTLSVKPEPGKHRVLEVIPDSWHAFEGEVEDWGWSVYEYGGAGDGNDYGDDIVYDLVENKVTTTDWYMERTEGEDTETELEIGPEESSDDDEDNDEAGKVQE